MARVAGDYRLNSFFSGVGGFELAFERNGFTVSFYCENDPFCRSVLRRHWPDVANASDIRDVDPANIPPARVWTAGFPCQDLSVAKAPHGRAGFRGNQSSLFFVFHELIAAHRPEVVVLENVTGLLNSHKGEDFQLLLEGLTDLGYAVAWRVLNARYFGVPQSRPRVFIVAWYGDPARAVRSLFEDELAEQPRNEREAFMRPYRCEITGAVVPEISYCISATSARHTGLDWARSYIVYSNRVRRPTPLETERLQGFPDHWTLPGDDYAIPINGVDTERYRAVGNAVAIPVVEWVAARIRDLLNSTPSVEEQLDLGELCKDTPGVRLRELAREFKISGAVEHPLRTVNGDVKWQRGGCAYEGVVVHAPASTAPVRPSVSRFVDLLEKRDIPERYFLSPNAARGILRRVKRRGRNLFAPLEASLRKLASDANRVGPHHIPDISQPVCQTLEG